MKDRPTKEPQPEISKEEPMVLDQATLESIFGSIPELKVLANRLLDVGNVSDAAFQKALSHFK